MTQPLISAIICTHNRAAYLGGAIASLMGQTYLTYEIIVVDNASTDDTPAVVNAFLPHPTLTYLYESNLGLSVARNRGAAIARGSILAYLDDDAEASPHWLAALAEIFEHRSKAAIAGGPVSLIWPQGLAVPPWLSPTLSESLGLYDLGVTMRLITTPGQTPRGLNYAVKKSFLEAVGGFDPQLGRVGKNLLSNEELHLTQQALAAGLEVWYGPQAQVAHNVAPERLRRSWFWRRSWWQGISECHREQMAQALTLGRVRVRGLCLVRGLVKALRHWADPALRFENLVYAYGQWGYVLSSLKYLLLYPKADQPTDSSVCERPGLRN